MTVEVKYRTRKTTFDHFSTTEKRVENMMHNRVLFFDELQGV